MCVDLSSRERRRNRPGGKGDLVYRRKSMESEARDVDGITKEIVYTYRVTDLCTRRLLPSLPDYKVIVQIAALKILHDVR